MRVEQVVKYFSNTASLKASDETNEDTVAIDDGHDADSQEANAEHYEDEQAEGRCAA